MIAATVGVGLTKFGRFSDRSLKDLVAEAVSGAVRDAGIDVTDIGAAFGSNSLAGLLTGQESVRTQSVLAGLGIRGVPVASVENACASGSTAIWMAARSVLWGEARYALAVGFEKMYVGDTRRTLDAIARAQDIDEWTEQSAGSSKFMEMYAADVRAYMAAHGATPEDFALVAVKNRRHGALNPCAQYQSEVAVDDILGSPTVAFPLTVLMCSPIGDGAAAVIFGQPEAAPSSPRLIASVLRSGLRPPHGEITDTTIVAREAYEAVGVGPEDIDVAEVHDAAAPAELLAYEELGFATAGEGPKLVRENVTALGGSLPVNPSGGLVARGHPIGATGVAMVAEIVLQLRGAAGARQVEGARLGLVHNAGGLVAQSPAAVAVHLLACP